MNNVLVWSKWFVVLVAGYLSSLLGGWDMAIKILATFVVLDYIVGVMAACVQKRVDSQVGFLGIMKKILIFVAIIICYQIDLLIGQDILRNLAIFFYIANEGISILENLGRAGLEYPPAIKDALMQLRGEKYNG